MRQQIRSRRPIKAPTGDFPPNMSAGLSARSCVTSKVHEEAVLWAIFFAPAGHRLNVFLRRRAPADLSIASPVLFPANEGWTIYGHRNGHPRSNASDWLTASFRTTEPHYRNRTARSSKITTDTRCVTATLFALQTRARERPYWHLTIV